MTPDLEQIEKMRLDLVAMIAAMPGRREAQVEVAILGTPEEADSLPEKFGGSGGYLAAATDKYGGDNPLAYNGRTIVIVPLPQEPNTTDL